MTSLADLWQTYLNAVISTGSGANAGAVNSDGKAEDTPHVTGDVGDFMLAVRNAASPAALTNANLDYSPVTVDAEGKLIIQPYSSSDYVWNTSGGPITKTDTTAGVVRVSAGAGVRNYLTDYSISNTSATAVLVNILDGAAVIHTVLIPAGQTVTNSFAIPLKGGANTSMSFQAQAAVTSLIFNAQGYSGV